MISEVIYEDSSIVDSVYNYNKLLNELKDKFVMNDSANFYYNGVLNFNNQKVSIRDMKIISTNVGYLLDYIHGKKLPEDIIVNKIYNFTDTTAFEVFIKKYISNVDNNELEVDENIISDLNTIIINYDGKINNLVPETMAINKLEVG